MIVRDVSERLILIAQPHHAQLSGVLADAWRADGVPVRQTLPSLLLAVREHDNGWVEPDATPLLDESRGRPHDFRTMPDDVKRRIWPRGVRRVAGNDLYAAALVAQHGLRIQEPNRGRPDWQPFFAELDALLERLLASAGHGRVELARDDALVDVCDLLSLIFCNGWPDEFEARGYRIRLNGDTLEVLPDPFGGAAVPLRVQGRQLPAHRYRSQVDLLRAFEASQPVELTGMATGGS